MTTTNIFERHELDALLGEHSGDFDTDGIIEDATATTSDGSRVWTAFGDELNGIIERHDISGDEGDELRRSLELIADHLRRESERERQLEREAGTDGDAWLRDAAYQRAYAYDCALSYVQGIMSGHGIQI